jgi:glutaminyl-peptide cyclotransferase
VLLCAAAVASAGCAPDAADPPLTRAQAPVLAGIAAGVPQLRPVVLGTLPHDRGAWTEGLEIDGDTLYESTGLAGRSRLRRLDPATGAQRAADPLPDGLYGEGLTVLGDRIWQLTYRDGVALGWDTGGRAPVRRTPWSGEGWGLCHTADGRVLASDGSSELRVLAGIDLTRLGTLAVRIAGRPLPGLNELECTPGAVWANVYPTDWLARIDPGDGRVTAVVDASGLLPPDQRSATGGTAAGAVLNGIAAIPGTDEFLLTGKLWPTLYRVRFTR